MVSLQVVTGHMGFIGKRMTDHLSDWKGCDLKDGCDINLDWNIPFGASRVYHLAATAGINDCYAHPQECFDNNLLATFAIAQQCAAQKIPLTFTSSLAAANTSSSFYAAAKGACELLIDEMLPGFHSIFRLSNVYGPGSENKTSVVAAMCKEAIKDNTITVHGDGRQTRDLVYVDDVCQALVDSPPGKWNLCTGVQTEIKELALYISQLSGAEVRYAEDISPGPVPVNSSFRKYPKRAMVDWESGVKVTYRYFRDLLGE